MKETNDSSIKKVGYNPLAPWPCMRGNNQSTGVRTWDLSKEKMANDIPVRHFSTGNGIFSTPIIGPDETLYIGSGDSWIYALDPIKNEEKWRFKTGEVIDCAGTISDAGTLFFASCDASMYSLTMEGKLNWQLNLLKDRRHFSPSTIYWWEANVVIGPNGLIFAGCDDFYLYAIEPETGNIRWASMTGMNVWTAPAFSHDGELVYIASFDTNAYAFEADTGKLRWKTKIGNFIASSPAVGNDGTVYLGSFDGHLYALDGKNGKVKWRVKTDGAVYASTAIAPSQTLYVGSSDGSLYAINSETQEVLWTYYTGDAIRGSASLGPDPEGLSPYLIYFGSGNGTLYALDPSGKRRWSYDTLSPYSQIEYPNINASIALGDKGLATATANGDVIWIPYNYYLQKKAKGITTDPGDGYPDNGTYWYLMSQGGTPSDKPLVKEEEHDSSNLILEPTQTISLHAIIKRNAQTLSAKIVPESVQVEITPEIPVRVSVQPDGQQINIIPEAIANKETKYSLLAKASLQHGEENIQISGKMNFTPRYDAEAADIKRVPENAFSITHMSIYSPNIIPTFDQMGIASQMIEARIVSVDEKTNRVVGWGLNKFGVTETGELVGVPVSRHFFFAFGGTYKNGHLIIESLNCQFETTAFPLPLNLLRFTCAVDKNGIPIQAGSMLAEYKLPKVKDYFSAKNQYELSDASQIISAFKRNLSSGITLLKTASDYISTWIPKEHGIQEIPQIFKAAAMTVPLFFLVVQKKTYKPWGLFDEQGQFTGVGTFKLAPVDQSKLQTPKNLKVEKFYFDEKQRRFAVEFDTGENMDSTIGTIPGVLLIDEETLSPMDLDYNSLTHINRDDKGCLKSCYLDIPLTLKIKQKRIRALAMADLCLLDELKMP